MGIQGPELPRDADIYGLAGAAGSSDDAPTAKAPTTPLQVFQGADGNWRQGKPVDGKPGTFEVGETEFAAKEGSTTFKVGQTVSGTTADEKNHAGTLERVTGDTATIKDTNGQETSVPASTLKPILIKDGKVLAIGDKVVEIHDRNQEPKTIRTIDQQGWVTFEDDPNMKVHSSDVSPFQEEAPPELEETATTTGNVARDLEANSSWDGMSSVDSGHYVDLTEFLGGSPKGPGKKLGDETVETGYAQRPEVDVEYDPFYESPYESLKETRLAPFAEDTQAGAVAGSAQPEGIGEGWERVGTDDTASWTKFTKTGSEDNPIDAKYLKKGDWITAKVTVDGESKEVKGNLMPDSATGDIYLTSNEYPHGVKVDTILEATKQIPTSTLGTPAPGPEWIRTGTSGGYSTVDFELEGSVDNPIDKSALKEGDLITLADGQEVTFIKIDENGGMKVGTTQRIWTESANTKVINAQRQVPVPGHIDLTSSGPAAQAGAEGVQPQGIGGEWKTGRRDLTGVFTFLEQRGSPNNPIDASSLKKGDMISGTITIDGNTYSFSGNLMNVEGDKLILAEETTGAATEVNISDVTLARRKVMTSELTQSTHRAADGAAGAIAPERPPAQAGAPGAPAEYINPRQLRQGDQVTALDSEGKEVSGVVIGTSPDGNVKIQEGRGGGIFESNTILTKERPPIRKGPLQLGEAVIMKFKGRNSPGLVKDVKKGKASLDPIGGKKGKKYERKEDSLIRKGDAVWLKGPNKTMTPCQVASITSEGAYVTIANGRTVHVSADQLEKKPRCTTPGFPNDVPQPETRALHSGGQVGTIKGPALIGNKAGVFIQGDERPMTEQERALREISRGKDKPLPEDATLSIGEYIPTDSVVAEGGNCLVYGRPCTLKKIGEDGTSTVTRADGQEVKGIPNKDIQPASSLAGRVSKANPDDPKTNADKTSAKIKNGFKKLAKSPRFQNILKGGRAVEGFNSQLTGLSCILFPSRASQLIENFNKYRDQIIEWGNRKAKPM